MKKLIACVILSFLPVSTLAFTAFAKCGSLKSISIPASVIFIDIYAFNGSVLENMFFAETSGWQRILDPSTETTESISEAEMKNSSELARKMTDIYANFSFKCIEEN